jgi:hypothetical protein
MTGTPSDGWPDDEALPISDAVPTLPEDREVFRLAQLSLLLEVAASESATIGTVDRLGFYEFFSANPFVVVSGQTQRDIDDRLRLRLAGFTDHQLSYASTGQRFASRRRKLQHDLALLLACGVVAIDALGYSLTPQGLEITNSLNSVYADSYRDAALIVIRRLRKLSDRELVRLADSWLGQSWLLIDLLDDVTETTTRSNRNRASGRRRRGNGS